MCKMDKQLLYSYADNTIEPLEKIILEEHLKYCKECENELKEIKNMEYNLEKFDFEDIEIPDRLSILSEIIYDNCLNEVNNEKLEKIAYSNYKESLKLIKSAVFRGYKLRYNNPYDRLIKKNLNAGAAVVKKAAEKYCEKKLENNKIYKILKAV